MSDPFRIRVAVAGAALFAAVLVAGCGGSEVSPLGASAPTGTSIPFRSPATTPVPASPTISPSTAHAGSGDASEAAGTPIGLKVATGAVGTFLTGRDGRTLYTFLHDPSGGSACNLDCATTWPPFVLGADERVVAGDGVTGLIELVARADGTTQVTYKGHPLYSFSGDIKAGDTTGDGNGAVWSLARP